MREAILETAGRPPPAGRRNFRVSRTAVRRSLIVAGSLISLVLLWALNATYKAISADRVALEAAHASSVRLVRLAMELQAELDMMEDHDRWTLNLYLRLERETMPVLQRDLENAIKACPDHARAHAHKALGAFGEEAHRHSHAMLQALQRQAARNRKRSNELASSVLAQARADRERLRTSGRSFAGFSDSDLEGPLVALARTLRRPNATFELSMEVQKRWEDAAAEAMREGGAADRRLVDRLHELVARAPLPQNDKMRNDLMSGTGDPAATFLQLLQRARLHRHMQGLLGVLESWEAHTTAVWDVIEHIERLRSQHVFPMSLLRLAEHEWDSIVMDVAESGGRAPHAFDADQ